MMEHYPEVKQKTAPVEAMNARQMQEVKGMVFMAKQYPRDENYALQRILKACERKSLAEQAVYEYPRGGTKVSGPSIRLAETIAQNWGNIDFGIVELEQNQGESTVMAYAWDLETNTRQTKIFSVPHIRATKKGSYRLTDPRDVYELVANMGARRMRACILGIIPGDVVEAAVDACKSTQVKYVGDINKAREKMVKSFAEYKVTVPMLEKYIGCNLDAFTPKDIVRLSGVYTSIKDGMSKPQDHFEDIAPAKPEQARSGKTKLDKDLEKVTDDPEIGQAVQELKLGKDPAISAREKKNAGK